MSDIITDNTFIKEGKSLGSITDRVINGNKVTYTITIPKQSSAITDTISAASFNAFGTKKTITSWKDSTINIAAKPDLADNYTYGSDYWTYLMFFTNQSDNPVYYSPRWVANEEHIENLHASTNSKHDLYLYRANTTSYPSRSDFKIYGATTASKPAMSQGYSELGHSKIYTSNSYSSADHILGEFQIDSSYATYVMMGHLKSIENDPFIVYKVPTSTVISNVYNNLCHIYSNSYKYQSTTFGRNLSEISETITIPTNVTGSNNEDTMSIYIPKIYSTRIFDIGPTSALTEDQLSEYRAVIFPGCNFSESVHVSYSPAAGISADAIYSLWSNFWSIKYAVWNVKNDFIFRYYDVPIYSKDETSDTSKIYYGNMNKSLEFGFDKSNRNVLSFDTTPTYPDNPLYIDRVNNTSNIFEIYILMPNDNATLSDYENRIGVMVNENNLPSNKISLPLDSSYVVDQNLYIYDDDHQAPYENVKFIYADISHMTKITSTNGNHYIVAYINASHDKYYNYFYNYTTGGRSYINDSSHQGTISIDDVKNIIPFVDLSSTAGVLLTGQNKSV